MRSKSESNQLSYLSIVIQYMNANSCLLWMVFDCIDAAIQLFLLLFVSYFVYLQITIVQRWEGGGALFEKSAKVKEREFCYTCCFC